MTEATIPASRATVSPVREVLNQPPPLEPIDLFAADAALTESVAQFDAGWAEQRLGALGALAGSSEAREHGRRAERNEPRLLTHDRFGRRIDEVELDPSWHWLLRQAVEHEVHSLPWTAPQPGAHVVHAASVMLWMNANSGVLVPVQMTYSVVPVLREVAPEIAAEWEPRLTTSDYSSCEFVGLGMTERQGGSDVRANVTQAIPIGDGEYELTGHKWFCSYPPCAAFLVLAQAPAGLSCFLVERGSGVEFQRLKDKLGYRSLPSAELELRAAPARLVGEEGRGVSVTMQVVGHARFDCLNSSAALMRRGTVEAIHHARHRSAFGAPLVDQPAMTNVLADLALESEAATTAALRVAATFDRDEGAFGRLATAVCKYHVCKRAAAHAAEALECLGGNGFVEDSGMPQLYRDTTLPSVWEGSGNVAALDVLRVIEREPESLSAFIAECELAEGADPRLDSHMLRLRRRLAAADQSSARCVAEELAIALQASLLVRLAPPAVADAFCAARLDNEKGRAYGASPAIARHARAIVDRALPG